MVALPSVGKGQGEVARCMGFSQLLITLARCFSFVLQTSSILALLNAAEV